MLSRARRAALTLVLGVGIGAQAWADVYALTAADGSVSLSNVPVDERYRVMIREEGGEPARAPAAAARKGSGPAAGADLERIIDQVSRAYGVESALLHAVVAVESRYDPKAVSRKGAMGLMQLMPDTARRYGVRDAFDPLQNVDAGARYLRDLLRMFDNDVGLALAAYNAGERAVTRHGNRIPPYTETRRYVPQVLEFYQRLRTGS